MIASYLPFELFHISESMHFKGKKGTKHAEKHPERHAFIKESKSALFFPNVPLGENESNNHSFTHFRTWLAHIFISIQGKS
jgi:hypothetical protein